METKYCDNPLIIGGSGSSGSTLLKTILNKHSKIAIGSELSLFNKNIFFESSFKEIKNNIDVILDKGMCTDGWFLYPSTLIDLEKYGWNKSDFINMTLSANSHKEFIDNFMLIFLNKSKKKIWGEKTPANSYCFDKFSELYPKARFIHLYRDGRDVVTSLVKRGMNPYYATMMWLYNTASALKYRNNKNYIEIRYESFVNNPKKVFKNLLDFLNLDYEEATFKIDNTDTYKMTSWKNSPAGSISSSSIGTHKKLNCYSKYAFLHTVINKKHAVKKNINFRTTRELQRVLGYDLFDNDFSNMEQLFYIAKVLCSYISDIKNRYLAYRKCYKKEVFFPGGIKMNNTYHNV